MIVTPLKFLVVVLLALVVIGCAIAWRPCSMISRKASHERT